MHEKRVAPGNEAPPKNYHPTVQFPSAHLLFWFSVPALTGVISNSSVLYYVINTTVYCLPSTNLQQLASEHYGVFQSSIAKKT